MCLIPSFSQPILRLKSGPPESVRLLPQCSLLLPWASVSLICKIAPILRAGSGPQRVDLSAKHVLGSVCCTILESKETGTAYHPIRTPVTWGGDYFCLHRLRVEAHPVDPTAGSGQGECCPTPPACALDPTLKCHPGPSALDPAVALSSGGSRCVPEMVKVSTRQAYMCHSRS